MLSSHANFGVAVVNDEMYVISGATANFQPPSVANEKYTPTGYGTPDSFTPSPSPSPSPTPSPDPTPSAAPFPTALIAVASVTSIAIATIALIIYLKKHKR